jgi:hypothetical protein
LFLHCQLPGQVLASGADSQISRDALASGLRGLVSCG